MNKFLRILVLVTMTCFHASLLAQQLSLNIQSGIASFKMSEPKEYNNLVILSLPFEAKVTDDFPNYWFYKSSIEFSFRKLVSAGIIFSSQSTGSRVAVSDYSGEFKMDMKLKATGWGMRLGLFYPINNFKISFENLIGVTLSHLDFMQYFRLNTESDKMNYAFKSRSNFYEPSLKITYRMGLVQAGIQAGYQFDFNKGNFSPITHYYDLKLADNNIVKPNWSGFRLGASMGFVLNLSKKR